MNNKLEDKRTKKLLISNILFRSGKIITSIFLNIYLWKNTNDIKLVALFNIIYWVSFSFSYTFFSKIIKNSYKNLFFIFSISGIGISYLFLLIFGEKIIEYNILLASILGFFTGIYWIIYNNNEFDLTHNGNRGNYQGLKKSLKTLTSIIIPSLIGVIIGLNYLGYGYEISFLIGILFFFFSGVFGIIKVEHKKEEKSFSLFQTLKIIIKEKNLLKIFFIFFLLAFALSNTLIEVVLPLLLYSYGVKEMQLGFLISMFSILTIIVSYIFGKFIDYKHYKLAFSISGIIYIFMVLVLLFFPNYFFIIVFSSILNLIFTFMDVPKSVYGANLIENIKGFKDFKTEYITITGLATSFGWIVSFSTIYFIGSFDILGVNILFGIMALSILLAILLFRSIKD